MTRDISTSGVRFATRAPLALGQTLQLTFELGHTSLTEATTIETRGQVVRIGPDSTSPKGYEIAMATDDIEFGPIAVAD